MDVRLMQETISGNEKVGEISADLYAAIDRLWANPGIKEAYERRVEFQLPDAAK